MSNRAPDGWVIAIDGPAGAGKTTVGRGVALALHALDFDTGVLYRVVTFRALEEGVGPGDDTALAAIARALTLESTPDGAGGRRLIVAGVNDPLALRSPEVDRNLSEVSAHAAVRAALVDKQREIARLGRVVLIGRDIGTVIAPDADLKIYLEASPQERARRRFEELRQRGVDAAYEQVLADIERRDQLDSGRAVSPLRPAEDAVIIDTDGVPAEEVVQRIVDVARERIQQPAEAED
jgi:cytidylate kinase